MRELWPLLPARDWKRSEIASVANAFWFINRQGAAGSHIDRQQGTDAYNARKYYGYEERRRAADAAAARCHVARSNAALATVTSRSRSRCYFILFRVVAFIFMRRFDFYFSAPRFRSVSFMGAILIVNDDNQRGAKSYFI